MHGSMANREWAHILWTKSVSKKQMNKYMASLQAFGYLR